MSKIIINGKSDGALKAYMDGQEVNGIMAGGVPAYTRMETESEPEPPTPPAPTREYLRLYSNTTASSVKLRVQVTGEVRDPGLEYSTDGTAWTAIPITQTGLIEISLPRGVKSCYLRSEEPLSYNYGEGKVKPYLSANYRIGGHIASIIDWRNMQTLTEIPSAALFEIFSGISTLIGASQLSFDGITTVRDNGCAGMFLFNDNLTSAPAILPATALEEYAYTTMFYGCSSLTTAPALPATTLAYSCYHNMFNGCTSLASAPELPATTLAGYCYNQMLQGCTSLTTAPALPATTLANYCYYYMFNDCTSLTTAPELPATTLADGCYSCMFEGCTNLNSVRMNVMQWNPESANNWLFNTLDGGTVYAPTGSDIADYSDTVSGVPSGWTVQYY